MRSPTHAQALDAWEDGSTLTPVARALRLLALAFPDEPTDQLAERPIGDRDASLLELRKHLFGSAVTALVFCPGCGHELESQIDLEAPEVGAHRGRRGTFAFAARSYRVEFRLPNSADLT